METKEQTSKLQNEKLDLTEIARLTEQEFNHDLLSFVVEGDSLHVKVPYLKTWQWREQGIEDYHDLGIDVEEIFKTMHIYGLRKKGIIKGYREGNKTIVFEPDQKYLN